MTSPGTTSSQFFLEFDDNICPITFCGFDVEAGRKALDLSKRDSEARASLSKNSDFVIFYPSNWPTGDD